MTGAAGRPRFRLDIWHVVLTLPFFALGVRIHAPIRDNSFLWHVGAGRAQIDAGAVLTSDPFSFTRLGAQWRTQSWLADLLYAWADGLFALSYVPWLIYSVAALFLGAAMIIGFQVTGRVAPSAVVGLLTTYLTIAFLNPRPVIFSFLLFALVVLAEGDGRLRWGLPLVFWIWAALHGSFVIGGIYVFLQAIRRRRWTAWKELLAIGAAVSLTAHGWSVWEILVSFARSREGLTVINEWGTPDLVSLPMLPLFAGLVLLLWAGTTARVEARDLLLIVPFLAVALTANRSVPPAWIALLPFLAAALRDLRFAERRHSPRRSSLHAVMAVGLVVGPLVAPIHAELEEGLFPVEAAEHLRSDRVFHGDGDGGYLIYATWPERLVYIDDRAELYGDMLVEFTRVRGGGPEWQEVFARLGIDEVLVRKSHDIVYVLELVGWSRAHEDDAFVVLRPPAP